MSNVNSCPSGSGIAYTSCCGTYIEGHATALTAKQLMRSRYSAYVMKAGDYVLRTWDATTRPQLYELRRAMSVTWLDLKIIEIIGGGENDTEGTVEFVTRHKVNGRALRLHECSSFRRLNGQWFYVDGTMK